MGNLLVQVRASGELASLAEMRAVIRQSSDVSRFEPKQSAAWQEGIARFEKLRSRAS
jgi:rhamnulokinase